MATKKQPEPNDLEEPAEPEEAVAEEAEPEEWYYGATPYYVDGVRVDRATYAEWERQQQVAADVAELDAIAAEETSTTPPPADPATSKE
jgi:hypothetical protein